MLKSLVDIDVRKTATFLMLFAALAIPISKGEVSLDHVVYPPSLIPWVQGECGFWGWVATVLAGAHGLAAWISPRIDADTDAVKNTTPKAS